MWMLHWRDQLDLRMPDAWIDGRYSYMRLYGNKLIILRMQPLSFRENEKPVSKNVEQQVQKATHKGWSTASAQHRTAAQQDQ